MPASRRGNSPATKQVTGLDRICARCPRSPPNGPGLSLGGGACPPQGAPPAGCPPAPAPGGTAEATATRATSAVATLPSATATRTGAWPTVRPAWLFGGHAVLTRRCLAVNVPSSPEVAPHDGADCSSMKATVTPESGRALHPGRRPDRSRRPAGAQVPGGQREEEGEEKGGGAAHGRRPAQA